MSYSNENTPTLFLSSIAVVQHAVHLLHLPTGWRDHSDPGRSAPGCLSPPRSGCVIYPIPASTLQPVTRTIARPHLPT